jgi:2-dehydropantoate 2-reductase
MMAEAQAVAEALGAGFRHTIEKRIEGARAVGAHKTSMLQDVQAGRPLELDALMRSVLELARLVDVETPMIRAIYACTALLNDNLRKARQADAA